ncbi:MAG: type II toxin-antitoxin system Phd/YefM family antitoxin [Gammaproteobacteria bacterium]
MPEVGAYEAKTHLPSLLERVEKGERFIITKHGRPVAELRPVSERSPERIRSIVGRMKAFQATHDLAGTPIRELIDESRKY